MAKSNARRGATQKSSAGAASYLVQLLQATFFEAHAEQRRVIGDSQLEEAALGLVEPEKLGQIRSEMPKYDGRAERGHYVELITRGACGTARDGDEPSIPRQV